MAENPTVYQLEVILNKEITQLMADLIDELNELTDMIPDWNNIEKENVCEKISLIMGKLIDTQKASKNDNS